MGQSDASQAKAASRQRAINLAQPDRVVTAELATWLLAHGVKRVAGFLPLASEVDVRPTLTSLSESDVRIALPRTQGESMDFIIADVADATNLTISSLGTLEPRTGMSVAANKLDAVLVPALACDHSGARLGRGGGYYDRALADLPAGVPVIAVLHDEQFWPTGDVPMQPHDVRVHAVATPTVLVMTQHGQRAGYNR